MYKYLCFEVVLGLLMLRIYKLELVVVLMKIAIIIIILNQFRKKSAHFIINYKTYFNQVIFVCVV